MTNHPSPAIHRSTPQGSRFGAALLVLALILVIFTGLCVSGQCVELQFKTVPPVKVAFDSPAAALEGAFTQVAKAVSPAVVNISIEWTERIQTLVPNIGNMQDFFNNFGNPQFGLVPRVLERKQQALGSGFIITPDGFILTNAHVVGKADKITVLLENGQTFPAQVVGKDEKIDIALIKIDAGKTLPCVTLADSDTIQVGQWAIAIGNPFGFDHTLTAGVISAKGRRGAELNEDNPYSGYLQTDASINPGNSGGPLCNLQGEVIGINNKIYSQSGVNIGIGFAIPSNLARKVALDLARQGRVMRAGLGANVQPLDSKMASSFGLPDSKGALINNIGKESAAEKAGIKVGDVILEIDGEAISNPSDLITKLYSKSPGDRVSLSLMREKRKINSDVILQPIDDSGAVPAQVAVVPVHPEKENEKSGLVQMKYQDVENMSPELKAKMNPSAPHGPVILEVKAGGPADAAGLRVGDVILQAGDKKITNEETLGKALAKANFKKGLRLFVWREGVTMYAVLQANAK
jgi:serine protease Do